MKNNKSKKVFILLGIFLFSFCLRLWNLNAAGSASDENAQAIDGYNFIELIKNNDYANPYWYNHPFHPPLTKYIYGIAAYGDIADHHKIKKPPYNQGEPTFKYEWTTGRLVSVVFGSLSVVIVSLIGLEYISMFVGIAAGIIMAMLPFFLGLSQLVTIESVLVFFFTASFYAFLRLLKKTNAKNIILAGILLGLAFETKYTNVLLVPIFIWVYALWFFYEGKYKRKEGLKLAILYIFPISVLVFFILWPMPWLHFKEVIDMNYQLRIKDTGLSIPEVFYGKLILVPKVYYIVHFLITTPLVILLLFFYGAKKISDFAKNVKGASMQKWLLYALIIFFLVPFSQSLYNFRQHGVRYIIEIYTPLSLIAAYGFEQLVAKYFDRAKSKYLLFIPVVIYMFIILWRITPYYLDYFNVLVGGAKNVYEKRLFQLGWWGEGVNQAVTYLDTHASKGTKVGLAIKPLFSLPEFKNIKTYPYNAKDSYDYVIVNHFNIIREGFNDEKIREAYTPVYYVNADGAYLVTVYKRK